MSKGVNNFLHSGMEAEITTDELQEIACIGWCKINFTKKYAIFSDFVVKSLDLESNVLCFHGVPDFIQKDHIGQLKERFLKFAENDLFTGFDEVCQLNTVDGYRWIHYRIRNKHVDENGCLIALGYIQFIDEELFKCYADKKEKTGPGNLFKEWNNISQLLLGLLRPLDTANIVNNILMELLKQFGGDRVYIFEFDWNKRTHSCIYEVTKEHISEEMSLLQGIKVSDTLWWSTQLQNCKPIILNTLDDLPPVASYDKQILEEQGIVSLMAVPLLSENGTWGYMGIDIVDKPYTWSSEDYERLVSLSTIISICLQLRKSEKYANEEKSYFENLYQNMPIGYIRIKLLRDGKKDLVGYEFMDMNPVFEKMAGIQYNQLTDIQVSAILAYFDIDQSDFMNIFDCQCVREKDVEIHSTQQNYHILFCSPERDIVVILLSDMTNMVKANRALHVNESRLQTIYNNIPVGISIYDRDGYMLDINEMNCGIFGYETKSDAIGKNIFDIPDITEEQKNVLRKGGCISFDINYVTSERRIAFFHGKSGDVKNLSIKITALYDASNSLDSYLLLVIDNTESLHLLNEAKLKAEESERLKSAFLANMSHEIRTPLNAIIGFSDLLVEDSSLEERTQYMAIIQRNNQLLLQIINDILDFSKLEAGVIEVYEGEVDVNDICYELIQIFKMKAPENISIHFCDHMSMCVIQSDRNRIIQVLSNFLSNALKFTSEGEIRLGYIVEKNEIEFFVHDTGMGIPPEHLESVFERFVKLNNFADGVGLGLPICKSMVERMGGRIGVESEVGVGSFFWFTLPYRPILATLTV